MGVTWGIMGNKIETIAMKRDCIGVKYIVDGGNLAPLRFTKLL